MCRNVPIGGHERIRRPSFLLHFLIASLFISCHKRHTVRQKPAVNDLWKAIALEVLVLRATTHFGGEFELPQCTASARSGGSRSFWAFFAAPSRKRAQCDESAPQKRE